MGEKMAFSRRIRDPSLVIFLSMIVLLFYLAGKGPWLISTITSSPAPTVATNADELEIALFKASMPNKTLIITPANWAWMEPNSLIDLYLESLRIGEGTRPLLKHLLIVAIDERAFNRCKEIHEHCYQLRTEGVDFSGEKSFMSKDYVKVTQAKILFLKKVVERGYSFLFSDADIIWFRNPFPRFSTEMDIQFSCDDYSYGPHDLKNHENTGFAFVTSNQRTIKLYDLWHANTHLYSYTHDQNVFDRMKYSTNFTDIGLKILFIDTNYFGGFCEPKAKLEDVCTMHANCCIGLRNKIDDLKAALQDWILFKSFDPNSPLELRGAGEVKWRNRTKCQASLRG